MADSAHSAHWASGEHAPTPMSRVPGADTTHTTLRSGAQARPRRGKRRPRRPDSARDTGLLWLCFALAIRTHHWPSCSMQWACSESRTRSDPALRILTDVSSFPDTWGAPFPDIARPGRRPVPSRRAYRYRYPPSRSWLWEHGLWDHRHVRACTGALAAGAPWTRSWQSAGGRWRPRGRTI